MKIKTQLKYATAFVGMVAMTTSQAATQSVSASVVVNNTITMAVNAPLDFGTVAAFANDNTTAEIATMTIPADPAAAITTANGASGTARIIPLVNGSPADVSVSGAAPNYALNVSVAAATPDLTDPSGTAPNGFTMGTFTQYAYLEGNNQTFGSTTDATGALGLNIGATISTVTPAGGAAADNAVAYTDATYTGTFEVSINY